MHCINYESSSAESSLAKMAKFESPCQIFGLFLGAGLVAVGVIFFLNIEAARRYGGNELEESER